MWLGVFSLRTFIARCLSLCPLCLCFTCALLGPCFLLQWGLDCSGGGWICTTLKLLYAITTNWSRSRVSTYLKKCNYVNSNSDSTSVISQVTALFNVLGKHGCIFGGLFKLKVCSGLHWVELASIVWLQWLPILNVPFIGYVISIGLCWNTYEIRNNRDCLNLSLPRNSFNLELNSGTNCPECNSFLTISLPWHAFARSLYI